MSISHALAAMLGLPKAQVASSRCEAQAFGRDQAPTTYTSRVNSSCLNSGSKIAAVTLDSNGLVRPGIAQLHPALQAELPLVIAAGGVYAPPLSHSIIAWKERGQSDLIHMMSQCVAKGLGEFCTQTLSSSISLTLVPVPATVLSIAGRGDDVVHQLARAAGQLGRDLVGPHTVNVRRLLVRVRTRDQVGLDIAARMVNAHRSYRALPIAGRGRVVVLIDDVATTGATLVSCAQVLRARGWNVVGAVVISATKVVSLRPIEVYRGTGQWSRAVLPLPDSRRRSR